MLSETCPSINSPDCGFDRGAAMRVPVIEMRAFEDKRWRLCLLPVRRSRIPMSYSTPWLGSIQTVGSVPAPECLPVGLLHRLVSAVAPNARKPIQTAPKAMVPSLLPTANESFSSTPSSFFTHDITTSQTPGKPVSSNQSTLFALHGRFEKLLYDLSRS
jgi:hypothetical protein